MLHFLSSQQNRSLNRPKVVKNKLPCLLWLTYTQPWFSWTQLSPLHPSEYARQSSQQTFVGLKERHSGLAKTLWPLLFPRIWQHKKYKTLFIIITHNTITAFCFIRKLTEWLVFFFIQEHNSNKVVDTINRTLRKKFFWFLHSNVLFYFEEIFRGQIWSKLKTQLWHLDCLKHEIFHEQN